MASDTVLSVAQITQHFECLLVDQPIAVGRQVEVGQGPLLGCTGRIVRYLSDDQWLLRPDGVNAGVYVKIQGKMLSLLDSCQ